MTTIPFEEAKYIMRRSTKPIWTLVIVSNRSISGAVHILPSSGSSLQLQTGSRVTWHRCMAYLSLTPELAWRKIGWRVAKFFKGVSATRLAYATGVYAMKFFCCELSCSGLPPVWQTLLTVAYHTKYTRHTGRNTTLHMLVTTIRQHPSTSHSGSSSHLLVTVLQCNGRICSKSRLGHR